MRGLIQTTILLFSFGSLLAQSITFSGFVSDMNTGEKLIGASIYEMGTGRGTVTNGFGFYSLILPRRDTLSLNISYVGYRNETHTLTRAKHDSTLNTTLTRGEELEGVMVYGKREERIHERTDMSIVEIPINQVKALPAIGGEADVMKAFQLMPGVQSGNEGTSGLYVRGGSPDQNLILLDDVPLYYVDHLGGFVSIFNPDAVNTVSLTKGGFPARYGSRLSSVMEVRMKEGNMKQFTTQGTVGLVASRVAVEGPIKKDTTSFLISARRFMLDLLTRPISNQIFDGVSSGYTFYDINAKVNHRFSQNDRIYFSLYAGDDIISIKRNEGDHVDKDEFRNRIYWGNMLGALRWNHLYGQRLFSNLTLTYTRYRYATDFSALYRAQGEEPERYYNAFSSQINDLAARIDYEYNHSPNLKVLFGGNSVYHIFTPGIASYKETYGRVSSIDTTFNNQTFKSLENSIYIENRLTVARLKANLGLRASTYHIGGSAFSSLEPRVLLNLRITDNLSAKGSYAYMQQYVHLLSYSGVGLPSDLWVPATSDVPPQRSQQLAVGIAQSLSNNRFELSVEGYHKKLKNLIAFSEGATFFENSKDWQEKVETGGEGVSYGAELLLQKKTGALTGWIGYTISKTERVFSNLNNGLPFPFRYDRRHDLSIVLLYRINSRINISGTWVYATGQAITLPVGYQRTIMHSIIPGTEEIVPNYEHKVDIYNAKNSFRMRDYHKLDLGVNFTKQKRWGERTLNISIYNVYNRQNPYFYFFRTKEVDGVRRNQLYQQSFFPIIPSVSYSFKF